MKETKGLFFKNFFNLFSPLNFVFCSKREVGSLYIVRRGQNFTILSRTIIFKRQDWELFIAF